MSGKIKVGLAYKAWDAKEEGWPEKPHDFADEYTIEVSRADGVGVTNEEAITVLRAFLLSKFTVEPKRKRKPKREAAE